MRYAPTITKTTTGARIALLSAALLAVPATFVVGDPGGGNGNGGGGQRGPHSMGPGGRPTTNPGDRSPFERGGPMRGDRGGGGDRGPEFDKFRDELQEFLKVHSPNRWAAMNDNARNGGGAPVKFGGMFFRYGGLLALKKDDAELYDIKVRQIEIEDKEFGLTRELREAKRADNADDVTRINADLRKLADEYVTKRFEERTHRVAKLEKALADEKSALTAEQGRKDALVEQHIDAVRNQPTHRGFGPGPGGHDGPGNAPPPPAANKEADKDDAPPPPAPAK